LLGVEIRHLAALEAVADLRSFAAAARRLGYSQSAVSQQIATLERAAGVRLLDRPVGTRRVTVTEAGERLLRHAHRAADAMRAAEADLRALAEGEAGTLRVGTFPSAAVRLLPRVVRDFLARRPDVEIRLVEAAYDDELVRRLHAGEIELSFTRQTDDPSLASVHVVTDPYVLLAPAGAPLARGGRPVRLREVGSLPLIAYRRPDDGVEPVLRGRGIEPEVVFRTDESGAVQGLVAAGVGYAVVPRLTVDPGDPATRVVEVAGIPPREIALAWHADRTLSPAARVFVEVVGDAAEQLARAESRS
jgi:DNA-binding transcriptional LysR family regulator